MAILPNLSADSGTDYLGKAMGNAELRESPQAAPGANTHGRVSTDLQKAVQLLEGGVAEGAVPGGVLLVGRGDQILVRAARGTKVPLDTPDTAVPVMDIDAVFDIGGLTGLIATTSLLMRFSETGKFEVSDRISRFVQGFGVGSKTTTTIAHLLTQASGLPPHAPFFDELTRLNAGPRMGILASTGAKQYVYDHIQKIPLKHQPGERHAYSELNFIILGQLCELLSGLPLDRAFQRFVAQPFGLKSTSFINLALLKRRGYQAVVELFASPGICSKRERIISGEVFDTTSWAMGGVAGHNGLFATIDDLAVWCREILRIAYGKSAVLERSTLERFWNLADTSGHGWRYGWEAPSKDNGLADTGISPLARGFAAHGPSSLWIDPTTGAYAILLTNAQPAGHHARRFSAWRTELHGAIFTA